MGTRDSVATQEDRNSQSVEGESVSLCEAHTSPEDSTEIMGVLVHEPVSVPASQGFTESPAPEQLVACKGSSGQSPPSVNNIKGLRSFFEEKIADAERDRQQRGNPVKVPATPTRIT